MKMAGAPAAASSAVTILLVALVIFVGGVTAFSSTGLGQLGKQYARPRNIVTSLRMCGVVGIHLAGENGEKDAPVACQEVYDSLISLQHRGQDAAGIATMVHGGSGELRRHRGLGLAREVFELSDMVSLAQGGGRAAVGHVRYPTAGCPNSLEEAQPLVAPVAPGRGRGAAAGAAGGPAAAPLAVALGHNGHLENVPERRAALAAAGYPLATNSDSEVLLLSLAAALRAQGVGRAAGGHGADAAAAAAVSPEQALAAVAEVMAVCVGGYAAVALVGGAGLLAFRDPHGIRPLVLGERRRGGGGGGGGGGDGPAAAAAVDLAVASESVAFTTLGFSLLGDVGPGEAVFVDAAGGLHRRRCGGAGRRFAPCVYEYVYMARPDSVLDGVSVYAARQALGRRLARRVAAELGEEGLAALDCVVPVPETSRITAVAVAAALGLPYEEGLTKNRYIARTFLMPGQARREANVRKKLSPVRHVFAGRAVLLVDDSIVRGTTSRQIVRLARGAGARRVVFCSAAPPVRHPNVYGIDLARREAMVAHGRDAAGVAAAIGADAVVYQELGDLLGAVRELNPALEHFDASVFDGVYVTRGGEASGGGGGGGGGGTGAELVLGGGGGREDEGEEEGGGAVEEGPPRAGGGGGAPAAAAEAPAEEGLVVDVI